MATEAMDTRQAEIDRFYEETGYQLNQVGDLLVYAGDITIPANTSFTKLKGLEIYGSLIFEGNTSIKRLIDVKVWNVLELSESGVNEMNNVYVGADLCLPHHDCMIFNLRVKGYIC